MPRLSDNDSATFVVKNEYNIIKSAMENNQLDTGPMIICKCRLNDIYWFADSLFSKAHLIILLKSRITFINILCFFPVLDYQDTFNPIK